MRAVYGIYALKEYPYTKNGGGGLVIETLNIDIVLFIVREVYHCFIKRSIPLRKSNSCQESSGALPAKDDAGLGRDE
jgi:hypothetical protein